MTLHRRGRHNPQRQVTPLPLHPHFAGVHAKHLCQQGAVKQRARIKAALIQNKTQSVKPAAAAEPELVEPTRLKVKAKDRRAAEREHNVKQ